MACSHLFCSLNQGSSEMAFSTPVSLFLVLSLSLNSVFFRFDFRIFCCCHLVLHWSGRDVSKGIDSHSKGIDSRSKEFDSCCKEIDFRSKEIDSCSKENDSCSKEID